ncbi:MAG: VOC family protein [Candidatus Eisenbacteria bacterium]|nr:VOC family protein [Candidatus Eisenbacteria bacterium]
MTLDLGYKGDVTLAIQASDVKAAIRWYEERLGFKLLYHLEGMGWCELSTPVEGVSLGIGQAEKPRTGAGPVPTWGVQDIAAARKKLEDAGVRFDGETQEIPEMVKLATFYDPDGNAYMLVESLAKE